MRKKSLSTLGYIMEALNIQTVSMSRSIHVDASLVSKWKTGDRNLSPKSLYFEDIIDFIMQESTNTIHQTLKAALIDLYPHETIDDEIQLENLLRRALSNIDSKNNVNKNQLSLNSKNTVTAITFQENSGRREAILKLFDYAEAITMPGEMLFVDNEELRWLLEDESYTKVFIERLEKLIHRGFHAVFVIHYSSYKDQLVKLFDVCSSLIFHRNIDWYYYEYYDKSIINFSFFTLNRAISLLGFSSDSFSSSTMVFTDTNIVMQHELMARHVIENCKPIFSYFKLSNIHRVLLDLSRFRKRGALYSYLPAPVFLFSKASELKDILSGQVDDTVIDKCLNLNYKLRKMTESFFFPKDPINQDPFIYIFQYEELLHRASRYSFTSTSLSYVCGKPITINAKQYAKRLRSLADSLINYDINIILASNRDGISLPTINCWCQKDIWMVQMNNDGLRLSNEYTIVNAASTKWERCIRAVPSERKDKNSVHQFLLELADRCDRIKPI